MELSKKIHPKKVNKERYYGRFFEFLGFQNAMKQSANDESLGDLTNDLIQSVVCTSQKRY